MEAIIPFTSKIFLIYGVDLMKRRRIVNYFTKPLTYFMIIINFIYSVYRMFTHVKHLPVEIAYCAYMVQMLINLRTINSTKIKVKKIFESCSMVLSPEAKEKLKKKDRTFAISSLVEFVTIFSIMTYYTISDNGAQSMSLSLGYELTEGIKSDPSMFRTFFVFAILMPVLFFYLLLGYWVCGYYYIMTQNLLNEFSIHCHKFLSPKETGTIWRQMSRNSRSVQVLQRSG